MTHVALVVPFSDLAEAVDELRERTCVSKPSHGVPPHVTLLTPCPDDAAAIEAELAPFRPFDVSFVALDRFPGTLWLADPPGPFREMTEALALRVPLRVDLAAGPNWLDVRAIADRPASTAR